MKQRSPIAWFLLILACSWGGFVAFFIFGNFAVALIWGAEAEMNWPFSFLLLLLSPFVLIGGAIAATLKFIQEQGRRATSQSKETE